MIISGICLSPFSSFELNNKQDILRKTNKKPYESHFYAHVGLSFLLWEIPYEELANSNHSRI